MWKSYRLSMYIMCLLLTIQTVYFKEPFCQVLYLGTLLFRFTIEKFTLFRKKKLI